MPPETFIDEQDIAIIGMTGRFPGAKDIHALWKNVCDGIESIRPISDAELERLGVDKARREDPRYVKAAAVMDGTDLFDAGFFGYTPREAELMDPQHRVFLECAWEALEHAGYAPDRYPGAISVYAGASTNTYLIYNIVPNADRLGAMDLMQLDVNNGADFLSTRAAYKLDLRGPSYSMLSGCSTSLVATHVACQSLLNQECDMALAGGVSIQVKHPEGYTYVPGGVGSPDGRCRAFDAKAEGTIFGSGVGVVVLKRLADAVKDGDYIHAVIKGSAINNDGSHKVGFTAPSVEGQAAVIEEALAAAGVEPESIGYIEAHGTGTQLGDPIEIRALTKAFRYKPGTPRAAKMRCAVGSLKSNIGHLSNASGVASLIKAVMALEYQKLPPSLHFEKPSPEIDFANSPFYVNSTLADWKASGNAPRRAGVSSFGVGGTNAHVVLQEAPPRAASSASRPVQLLVLSAKSEAALEAATDNLARHLEENPGLNLADVAHTLQVGRQAMAFRRVVLCKDRDEAVRALKTRDAQRVWTGSPGAQDRPVAFVFSSQGAPSLELARALYASEPVFREHLDTCATQSQPHLGADVRQLLNAGTAPSDALAAPVRFCIEYALAQLWMSWGVKPKALLGAGAGEYVAACLAGVLELRDALALVAGRGQPTGLKLNAPKIPLVSSATGTWMEDAQATRADYWTTLPRPAARFEDGRKTLAQKPQQVQLEVGQGDTLTTLGRLWLDGVSPDWSGFYAREKRLRVPLPTYPFERRRYWLDPRPAAAAPRPATASAEKKSDIADWFYVPSWKRTPPRAAQGAKAPGRGWLLFADAGGVAEALAPKLAQTGAPVIRVIAGDAFGRRADGAYTLNPRRGEDYTALLQALQTQGQSFDGVVHLWGVTAEPVSLERALDTGFYSQLFLARALGTQKRTEPLAWWVAANGACKVESADAPSPEKAMLLGPCRVVPQEYPHITCRFVDVAAGGAEAMAAQLLAELQAGASDTVVAWRGRQRWVQAFEPVRLEAQAAPVRTLKEQGVYLITGGLAGLGHVLAGELARASRARLVLVEGPEFPAREQWPQWLSSKGEQDATSRKIKAAQALEAAGASVLVLGADLTDEARMRQVVARTVEHFGRLDGVIHAAGALGQGSTLGTIQETDASACAAHFAPQVQGLSVLRQVLPAEGPGFCLIVSSLSSILGGFGQVAHAAAAWFMDTFAERQSEVGAFPWISVDWDAMRFEESANLSALSPAIARYALQPQEGLEVIRRVLTQAPGGQLVLSTGDLEARRNQGPREAATSSGDAKKKAGAGHARPPLATKYVEPRTELERSVAAVWQQVLGIEKIGVNDDFFELGGHSLLATQLRNQIHADLKVDLPLRGLFETPTVAATAAKIEQEQRKNAQASEQPIAERLRSAFPTERQSLMEDYLRRKIAAGLRVPVEQLPLGASLAGHDQKMLGAELSYNLLQDFKFQFYVHEVQEFPTIPELARYLLAEMERLANPAKQVSDKPLSAWPLKPYRPQRVEGAAPAKGRRKNPPMVFVHSSPRAGSTLFRVMLAGHPKLFCPPEVNLLFFENMKEWRENIGFGNEMEWTTGGLQWAFMELMGLDSAAGQALIDRFVAENTPAQDIFAKLQELSGPRLLVDKTPSYALDPETLWRSEEMFDQPKYIFLYRHPYPVMESLVRLRFNRLFGPSLFGDGNVDPHVMAETVWALCNRNLLDFTSRVDKERVHLVQYEQLVKDPTAVMTGVCDFLGLPFDERVVQPYDGKRERMMGGLGDPNIMQHKGIDKGLGESWKKIKWPRALDASTLEIVARLGYEVEQSAAAVKPAAPAAKAVPTKEEAERLLANIDQLSDEQVAELLAVLEADKEQA